MKNLLIIIFVLLVQYFFGQKKVLIQEKDRTVFIDYSKNSKYKKQRVNFSFDNFEKQTFQYSLENIKKNKIALNKFDIKDLPRKWIELFQYKGKFYTYYYCDFCGDYRLEFRKNMILETSCEGPFIISVNSFKKENSKTFSFKKTNEINDKAKVLIHIIDKQKGIAIFETKINNEISYKLMVDASKINKFPMIVNDCPKSKQSEFNGFDKPDFKKLLKQNTN